jgi:hypothetical protein
LNSYPQVVYYVSHLYKPTDKIIVLWKIGQMVAVFELNNKKHFHTSALWIKKMNIIFISHPLFLEIQILKQYKTIFLYHKNGFVNNSGYVCSS